MGDVKARAENEGATMGRGVIRPMGLALSLAYFGLPALLFAAGFYGLMPLLIRSGLSEGFGYLFGLTVPLIILLAAALIWFAREGNPWTWLAFRSRFRLRRLGLVTSLYVIGGFLAIGLGVALVAHLEGWLHVAVWLPTPSGLPDFLDPGTPFSGDIFAVYDPEGIHPWGTVIIILVALIINIVGEELWWRGIVLPRQELAFGANAWWIHGLMWTLFHAFKWWELLSLLPVCLTIAWICSARKNTTPGLILHFVVNSLGLVPMIMSLV